MRLAVASHLAWRNFPGLRSERLNEQWPDETAVAISYKFCWSVLRALSLAGSCISMGSSSAICCCSQDWSSLPICPEKLCGPEVTPSRYCIRCLIGSSFKCNKQIDHWRGLPKDCSTAAITPPLAPVFTFVPSQPITLRLSKSRPWEEQNSRSPSEMSFAFPLFGVKWPT